MQTPELLQRADAYITYGHSLVDSSLVVNHQLAQELEARTLSGEIKDRFPLSLRGGLDLVTQRDQLVTRAATVMKSFFDFMGSIGTGPGLGVRIEERRTLSQFPDVWTRDKNIYQPLKRCSRFVTFHVLAGEDFDALAPDCEPVKKRITIATSADLAAEEGRDVTAWESLVMAGKMVDVMTELQATQIEEHPACCGSPDAFGGFAAYERLCSNNGNMDPSTIPDAAEYRFRPEIDVIAGINAALDDAELCLSGLAVAGS